MTRLHSWGIGTSLGAGFAICSKRETLDCKKLAEAKTANKPVRGFVQSRDNHGNRLVQLVQDAQVPKRPYFIRDFWRRPEGRDWLINWRVNVFIVCNMSLQPFAHLPQAGHGGPKPSGAGTSLADQCNQACRTICACNRPELRKSVENCYGAKGIS